MGGREKGRQLAGHTEKKSSRMDRQMAVRQQ